MDNTNLNNDCHRWSAQSDYQQLFLYETLREHNPKSFTERLVPSVLLRGSKLRVASPRVVEVSRTPTGKQATRSVPQEGPKSDNFLPLKRLPLIPSFLSRVRDDQALTDLDIP